MKNLLVVSLFLLCAKNGFADLDLIEAVKKGDDAEVENHLHFEVDPNEANESGNTPLLLAVKNGHENIVKLLLDNKFMKSFDTSNNDNDLDLIKAVKNGDYDEVENLLDFEVDPNEADKSGNTPLLHAVNKGHEKIVKLLLDNKFMKSINTMNNGNQSPLTLAVTMKNLDIAKLLLERGAKVDATTLLNWAYRDRVWGAHGLNSLHLASMQYDVPMIELLLDNGANVNEEGLSGFTSLMYACLKIINEASQGEHSQAVELLLRRGANVNQKSSVTSMTALMIAAERDNLDAAKILIENGADIHQKDNQGHDAQWYAVENKSEKVLRLLSLKMLS